MEARCTVVMPSFIISDTVSQAKPSAINRRVLSFAEWPPKDQELWEAGTAKRTGLRLPRHAEGIRPHTVHNARKAYGRFLGALEVGNRLDAAIGPAERVTFETVAFFFDTLRAAGNLDNTVKVRLFDLRTALRIMVPRAKFDWITRPAGYPLDAILKQEPKDDRFVPPSKDIFRWGLALMDQPVPTSPGQYMAFCRSFRNGLILAILACRAPRLGSLSKMCWGEHLYLRNGEYIMELPGEIVKNRHHIQYSLPSALSPYIDRYIIEIRPHLLDATRTSELWGNGVGGAFTYRSIQTMINRYTKKKFDRPFGPHCCRDALASSLAKNDPNNPGLAAVILGSSEGVVNMHYRKGRQADAAKKLASNIKLTRNETRLRAENLFKKPK